MGVVIKQSFWGSVLAYAGVALGFTNTLVLKPAFFDPTEIGVLGLVISNGLMIAPFVTLGFPGTYVRYFPYFRDEPNLDAKIFTFQLATVLLANLVLAAIVFLGLDWIEAIFASKSAEYNQYIFLTLLIIVFHSLFLQLHAYSRSILDVILPNFLKEVFLRLIGMLLVICFSWGWIDFDVLIYLTSASYLLSTAILFGHLLWQKALPTTLRLTGISRKWYKEMAYYSGYNLLLAGSNSIYSNISYPMVASMLGAGAHGIFLTCFYIGIIIEMPKRSMIQILAPIIARAFKENDMKEVEALYQKASLTLSTMGMLFMLGIVCNLDDLFEWIPNGATFAEGYMVVWLIAGAKIVDMAFSVNSDILIYSTHYRVNLYLFMLAALVILGLNYWLLPIMGITGAGIAFFASTAVFNLTKYVYIRQRMKLKLFRAEHFKLIAISGLLLAFFIWLPLPGSPLIRIMLRSLAITTSFTLLIYSFKVSMDINNLVKSLFKKYLNLDI